MNLLRVTYNIKHFNIDNWLSCFKFETNLKILFVKFIYTRVDIFRKDCESIQHSNANLQRSNVVKSKFLTLKELCI